MDIRLRKPLYTTEKFLTIRASIIEMRKNLAVVKTAIYNQEGKLCADGQYLYFTYSREKAEEMSFFGCEVINNELSWEDIVNTL